MKTTRDILVIKTLDGKSVCKCCGKEVSITKDSTSLDADSLRKHVSSNSIYYECDCEKWNEIIKSKNELDELNRTIKKVYEEYEKQYNKVCKEVYIKHHFNLKEHVWYREMKSTKQNSEKL